MSSNAASDGMFFVDHKAAPAPWPVAPVPPAAPAPVLASRPVETGGAMRDVPLGTLIFRAGLLAEEQLQDALQEGMRTGKRLGEVLAARGLITDTDLARLLAGQQGLAYVDAPTLSVDPAAVARLPEHIARIQNALAFALEEGVPVVAVGDPTDELLVESVRRALGVEPRLVVAAPGDLAKKIQEVYAARPTPLPQPAPVELTPVAEAPVAEPPGPAPLVTPMPMTAPPPAERAPEPEAAIPPVAPPAPTGAVSFLHAPAAVEHPLAPEPVAPQPVVAPAPEPTPVEPVSAPPAPPPAVEKPPREPVVVIAEASLAPAPAPAEPSLFVQAAAEAALAPAVVEPPPLAQQHPLPAPAAVEPTHLVALRLTGDDRVQIGGFADQDEAESFARTVVGRITRAEEQGEWPLFGDRFIRPQTIVSVDVVDRSPAT